MANILNKIFCGVDVKNTGVCDCYFDPKLIEGAILVPKNKVFTAEELSDENILATLQALVTAAKAIRIFPFGPFEAITDNTEEPTEQTFGYGNSVPVREGKYNWIFQFIQGGVTLSNNLRTFNYLNSKYSAIFIDASQNVMIGSKKKDVNGQNGLAGVPLTKLYTFPWKAPDGTNVTSYRIQFGFSPIYVNQLLAFRKIDPEILYLPDLVGLENVELEVLAAEDGADVITIGASTDCGADMADEFSTELEEVTAWIWKDAAGAVKTITDVTYNPELKGWDITTSDPDGAEDGDTITMAAPTVLAAPPISVAGYESDTVTLDLGS